MYPLQRLVSYFFSSLSHFLNHLYLIPICLNFLDQEIVLKGGREEALERKASLQWAWSLFSKYGHILLKDTFQLFSNFSNKARLSNWKGQAPPAFNSVFHDRTHPYVQPVIHSAAIYWAHAWRALLWVLWLQQWTKQRKPLQRGYILVWKQTKYRCKWNVEWLGQC